MKCQVLKFKTIIFFNLHIVSWGRIITFHFQSAIIAYLGLNLENWNKNLNTTGLQMNSHFCAS